VPDGRQKISMKIKNIMHNFFNKRFSSFLAIIAVVISVTSFSSQSSTGDHHIIDSFSAEDIGLSEAQLIQPEIIDSNLSLEIDCTRNTRKYVSIPVQYNAENQKVRVITGENSNIPYMGKVETDSGGNPLRGSYEHNYLEYQKSPAEFSLKNRYYENLTFYFKCRKAAPGMNGTVVIEKIEIVPKSYVDGRDFVYILAEILLFVFIIPGFLCYTVIYKKGQKAQLLALITPFSTLVFLVLYLVLLLNKSIAVFPDEWVLLLSYISLNLFFILVLFKKNELKNLVHNLLSIKYEILAVFIVMFGVAALITTSHSLPLFTIVYNDLRYLTYGAFGAHDPIFQYVNGIAILYDEPFSKYYEHGKLFYNAQDRGIIGGVIYAVVRGIAGPVHQSIANSYGYYLLFGSVLNVLVLLPIFGLHKYFFANKERPLLILLLISASAFVITNYYITWFKLAAAGLVISGIVVLLIDKKNIYQWLIAGIIWGLATNFHPSLALTYPIVTLWLLFRFYKEANFKVLSPILAFFILILSFALVNVPWTIVKSIHYTDTNKLFRQHFLASEKYNPDKGIAGSVKAFSQRYSLEENLERRSERVTNSFRLKELGTIFSTLSKGETEKAMQLWNRMEASYIAFVFLPLLFLLAINRILKRVFPATAWKGQFTAHSDEIWPLFITQALTVLLIIIASFGSLDPDITWHIPMSCLLIMVYILIHKNISSGFLGVALIVSYSLFAHYRLFHQFF
jgi:hypothetical protein